MAQPDRALQPGTWPMLSDGGTVRPVRLVVVLIVHQQQRRRRIQVLADGWDGEVGQRVPDPSLDPSDHPGFGPRPKTDAASEVVGVEPDVRHRCHQHQTLDRQPIAHRHCRGHAADRVGDDGLGRALGHAHRGQRVDKIQDCRPPRARPSRLGLAMAGSVERDHPVPGRDQGADECTELGAPPTPSVHQAHHGPLPPAFAHHLSAVQRELKRVPHRHLRSGSCRPAGHREPQALGPTGTQSRRGSLQEAERDPDAGQRRLSLRSSEPPFGRRCGR